MPTATKFPGPYGLRQIKRVVRKPTDAGRGASSAHVERPAGFELRDLILDDPPRGCPSTFVHVQCNRYTF